MARAPGALNYMNDFHLSELDRALAFDAGESSYALAQADAVVTSEDTAETLFGDVVYQKGGSVLRMLHRYLADRGEPDGSPEAPAPPWQVRRRLHSAGELQWKMRPRRHLTDDEGEGEGGAEGDYEGDYEGEGEVGEGEGEGDGEGGQEDDYNSADAAGAAPASASSPAAAAAPGRAPATSPAEPASSPGGSDSGLGTAIKTASTGGSSVFFGALTKYLQDHKYGSGSTGDLWKHFSDVAEQPLDAHMQRWSHQQGVPVLNVTKEGGKMKIEQLQLTQTGAAALQCEEGATTSLPLPEPGSASALGGSSVSTEEATAPAMARRALQSRSQQRGLLADAAPAKRAPWWIPLRYVAEGSSDVQQAEIEQCQTSLDWPAKAGYVKLNAGQYGVVRCALLNMTQAVHALHLLSSR